MKNFYSGVLPKFIFLLLFFLFIAGCAALAISALGTGAGIGIPYVFSDCADRTLNYPFDQVNRATPHILMKMDISMVEQSSLKNGKRILAAANDLDITIEMEKVTAKATRVTVNAKKSAVQKDKATAEEILNQLERSLAKK